jgi:hypothetical protein
MSAAKPAPEALGFGISYAEARVRPLRRQRDVAAEALFSRGRARIIPPRAQPTDRPLDAAGKLKLRFSLAETKPEGGQSQIGLVHRSLPGAQTPPHHVGEPSGARRFIIGPVSAPFRDSPLEGSGFEPSVPLPRLSSIRAVRAEIIGRSTSFGETESSMGDDPRLAISCAARRAARFPPE